MKEGFTKLYDCVVDEYLPQLSGAEFKLLILIIRMTIGWNKKRDHIAHNQFMKKTKLSRRSVTSALKDLEFKKMVLITNEAGEVLHVQARKFCDRLYYQITLPSAKIALAKAKTALVPMQKLHTTIDNDYKQDDFLKKNNKQSDADRILELRRLNPY